MSTNFSSQGPGALRYEQEIQTPLPSPMSETPARHISDDEAAMGRAPVKDPAQMPVPFRSTVAVPEGTPTVADLLGTSGDNPMTGEAVGRGPRVVVLHEHVKGGKVRGNVVWLSDILGLNVFLDAEQRTDTQKASKAQTLITKELRRLLALKAIRQALPEEAGYTQVTFVEGEQNLTSELTKTQEALAAERADKTKLTDELEQLRQRVLELQNRGQETPPLPGEEPEPPLGGVPPSPTPLAPAPRVPVPASGAPLVPSAGGTPPAAPPTPTTGTDNPGGGTTGGGGGLPQM